MTEFAPRRRRHSSVGVHLGDQGPRLSGGHVTEWSGGRVGSPLYLGDHQGSRMAGGRATDGGGGRRADRAPANGKVRSVPDAKVRTSVTDTKIMVMGMGGVGKSGECFVCHGVAVAIVRHH